MLETGLLLLWLETGLLGREHVLPKAGGCGLVGLPRWVGKGRAGLGAVDEGLLVAWCWEWRNTTAEL